MLENDFVVLSAFGNRCKAGFSLLIRRSLNAIVNLVFQVVTPNIAGERRSFFLQLEQLLDNPKWLVLVGSWNTILDSKIDKVGLGA